jgi:two-component system, NarL family, response regulator NreC
VAQGKPFFSPAIANKLLEDYIRQLQQKGLQDSYDLLTEREKEILQLLVMEKLNLHSSAEIVLYAVRKRIIA